MTGSILSSPGGRRRRRGGIYNRSRARTWWPVLFVLIAAIALALAVIRWSVTRPAALGLTSMPRDAVIEVAGIGSRAGTLTAARLKPGRYDVTVSRKGYETLTSSVVLKRGARTQERYVLIPKRFKVAVTCTPRNAGYEIRCSSGKLYRGTLPFKGVLPAGQVSVTLRAPGYNPAKTTAFIDGPREFSLLMDPAGQIVKALGVYACGPAPKGVLIAPDNAEMWVSLLDGPPAVEVYDPLTGVKKSTIKLNRYGAVEVAFSKDATRAYVSQMETARVYEIDRATKTRLRQMETRSSWSKVMVLSPDGRTIFVANWVGNDVSEIDVATGQLRRQLPAPKTPRGLYATADGKSLYIAGFSEGVLTRIDLATGRVKEVMRSGGALRHLIADEKRRILYASDMEKDTIWAIDLATDASRFFCSTDEKPNTIDLSPDGKVLFISCRGENSSVSYYIPGPEWGSVLLVDTSNGKVLDAIVGGNQCTALDVSDDGRLLVFSDFLDNRLRVYSVPSYDVLKAGGGGRAASHLADIKK